MLIITARVNLKPGIFSTTGLAKFRFSNYDCVLVDEVAEKPVSGFIQEIFHRLPILLIEPFRQNRAFHPAVIRHDKN